MNLEQQISEIVKQVLLEKQTKTIPSLEQSSTKLNGKLVEKGEAKKGSDPKEVGIGIGAAYLKDIHHTINGLDLLTVLKEIMAGIEEEGMTARVVRITRTSDVGFMGNDTAKLMGSGVAIGLQSKGTAVIHQKDLYPLTNLELFPQAPLLTLAHYRHIGKNAAKYAKGDIVSPLPIENDPMVRPKYQVKAALMHTVETEHVIERGKPIEIDVSF
jgi:glycerol dehydratase medium subunit/propanediol dehydratase medium subunit